MKKFVKLAPLSLVAVAALTGCAGTSESTSTSGNTPIATDWWDQITTKYAVGAAFEEDDVRTLLGETYLAAYDADFVTQTDYQRYYYPVSWDPENADNLEYEYTLTYYDNDVVGVSGNYYDVKWDGENEDPDYAEWDKPVTYSFQEYIWNDTTANTLNAVYTRDKDAANAYSFYKSDDMNWTAYDEIHAKTAASNYAMQYYNETMTNWNAALSSLSDYPRSSAYEGVISQRRGKTSIALSFVGQIDLLELFSCYKAGWGATYKNHYAVRFYEFEYTVTFTEKQMVNIYANIASFSEIIYVDNNAYDEDLEPSPAEDEVPYVDDAWAAKLDLEETDLGGMILPSILSTSYTYDSEGEATIPDLSAYRTSGPDDVGDNYFFDLSKLF